MLHMFDPQMIMAAPTFWSELSPLAWFGWKFAQVMMFVLPLALLVAALVLADRKIWAAVHLWARCGLLRKWCLTKSL